MFILITVLFYLSMVVALHVKKSRQRGHRLAKKVAFFHPFCNDGGGGEKVLWTIVQALLEECPPSASQQEYENHPIINIYSLEVNTEEIFTKVLQRFNIDLKPYSHRINIVHIPGRSLLMPKAYLTMLFHIFLPMVYCFKCLWSCQPDIFYDTTGFAFNFFLVKLLLPLTECRAYVHYPFISDDMVAKIRERRADFNNDAKISQSQWKTSLKLFYYNAILLAYKFLRFFVRKAEANSTWTFNHMQKIWGAGSIQKLVPPCSISGFLEYNKDYSQKPIKIISLAQYRPEKNHPLQIRVIGELVKKRHIKDIHLYICGTTRGAEDEKILENLIKLTKQAQLQNYITFCPNMKYPQLLEKLKEAQCGIHTMEAEHFGISIVEMLAAGCLVLAHNSAGPRFDIIKDQNFLANSQSQYYDKMEKIVMMSAEQKKSASETFRSRMNQFGEKQFKNKFREIFHS